MILILSDKDIGILITIGVILVTFLLLFIHYLHKQKLNRKIEKGIINIWKPSKFEDNPLYKLTQDKPIEEAQDYFPHESPNRELLSKTHIEIEKNIWVNKEQVPQREKDLEKIKSIYKGKDGQYTSINGKASPAQISNIVESIKQHKEKESNSTGIMEQLPDNMYKPTMSIDDFGSTINKIVEEKSKEEGILELLLKYLKE